MSWVKRAAGSGGIRSCSRHRDRDAPPAGPPAACARARQTAWRVLYGASMTQPRIELCRECRLRRRPAFTPNTEEEVDFIQAKKVAELVVPAGGTILQEQQRAERLYTLLIGWAFRYKTLPDGRRQILNFLLPGDLVGLQAKLFEGATHGVEALTDVTLCAFDRGAMWEVFRNYPAMALDLTWLGAREESMVDDALLTAGRRSAIERIAWLLVHLYERAQVLGMAQENGIPMPVTQAHIADLLGLSLVHVNRTLQALRKRQLFELAGGHLRLTDVAELRRVADYSEDPPPKRPLF